MDDALLRTALHGLHTDLGARMMPFAGYEMPVHYAAGVLKEHLQCRASAALFDVSHMGQIVVAPRSGDMQTAAEALERVVPADLVGLAQGRQRYSFFTTDDGGILDDFMVARKADHFLLVVNASRKAEDLCHLEARIADACAVTLRADRALVALQGPEAVAAFEALAPGAAAMRFMDAADLDSPFGTLWVTRSGYTGEDGVEVSVDAAQAAALARALLDDPRVAPAGLGARDSLRLEAGLCLYGADLDTATSPVEAGLLWAVPKVRRAAGARSGGFPGADRFFREATEGSARRRVGLLPEGRAPMRPGTALFAAAEGDDGVGSITSGAYGPSLEGPVSMGYVAPGSAQTGTVLYGEVRGRRLPVRVAEMPFRPAHYHR